MATQNDTAKKKAAKPSTIKPGRGEGGVRVSEAEFAAGAARREQVPTTAHFENAIEIAFAGRSNVGKSSLLNMMLARKGLARTSNTPGCTRQINFFDIRLAASEAIPRPDVEHIARAASEAEEDGEDGEGGEDGAEVVAPVEAKAPDVQAAPPPNPTRLVFVDLPGYGYAKVSKTEGAAWKQLLEGYLKERPTLRAVVILVDVRRGIEEEEQDLYEFLEERPGIRVIVAATKVDKLPRSAQKPAMAKISRGPNGERLDVVATSAETGAGREALWARIFHACRVE